MTEATDRAAALAAKLAGQIDTILAEADTVVYAQQKWKLVCQALIALSCELRGDSTVIVGEASRPAQDIVAEMREDEAVKAIWKSSQGFTEDDIYTMIVHPIYNRGLVIAKKSPTKNTAPIEAEES